MNCFVNRWGPCPTRSACENSGYCSDRDWLVTVASDQYPVEVMYGGCFNSGFNDGSLSEPFCYSEMDRPGIGCRDYEFTSEEACQSKYTSAGEYFLRTWLEPARSEDECLAATQARQGCLLPGNEQHLYWYIGDDCECAGGQIQNAWEWEDGVWVGGQTRHLAWLERKQQNQYEWSTSLSFETVEMWIRSSVEQVLMRIIHTYSISFGIQQESRLISNTLP